MKTRFAVAILVSAAIGLLAGGPAFAATSNVSIGDNFYSPETVTIQVGDAVAWTHNGQAPHSVTASNGSFDSSPGCPGDINACMQNGDAYSHTFNSAGSFGYYCKVHGQSMSGTVVVEGTGTSPGPSSSGTPLPNTGASPATTMLVIAGLGLLLVGGAVLFAARRRRA
jgi:LPXTG-motif cell wall-anchored protein